MTSGERREESVSVSLKELMKLEDERIDRERKLREAEGLAAQRAREEAEKKRREAEEERARAEAEERERLRLRDLEEEARREAMSRAAVEQARIAVEARARAEEAERERKHEIELARIRAEAAKKSGAGVVVGSGLVGFSIALVAAVVVHFGVTRPANDRAIGALEARVAAAERRANDMGVDVERERARASKAEGELATAQKTIDDLKSAASRPPSKAARDPARDQATPPTGSSKAQPKNPLGDGPCINDWDPLCGRIRTK
jgi:hypothetical protein